MLERYDQKTISLHWLVVALLALTWGGAQVIDFFPKGPIKINARSVHMALGLLFGFLMLYRLWWRRNHGRRFAETGTPMIQSLTKWVHFGLYVLIFAEVMFGLANVWGRGDVVFNLFKVPAFDPGDKLLKEQVEYVHKTVANAILIVVGMHAAAGLIHHFIWHDDVLRRMLPERFLKSSIIDRKSSTESTLTP